MEHDRLGSKDLVTKDVSVEDLSASPVANDRASGPEVRRIHLVAIGVSRFKQHGLARLPGADNDAEDFQNLLLKLGDNTVTVVRDYQATRENIETALKSVPADPSLHLIVYISTHGVLYRDRQTETISHYLMSHESQLRDFADKGVPFVNLEPEAMKTRAFLSLVHSHPALNKLIIVDACYAGHARWDFTNPGPSGSLSRTIVLAACGSRELAYEGRNGRFTSAVLQAIGELWELGRRFAVSKVHTEALNLLDSDPHFDGQQECQMFHIAGEGDFWFEPPNGQPSLTDSELKQEKAKVLFAKAKIARLNDRLSKARNLANEARRHYPEARDIDIFLAELEADEQRNSYNWEAQRQIEILRTDIRQSIARKDWRRADRAVSTLQGIENSGSVWISGHEIEDWRAEILVLEARETLAKKSAALAGKELERLQSDLRRTWLEGRPLDGIQILNRVRQLYPTLTPALNELRDKTRGECANLAYRIAAEVRGLAQVGRFDEAFRLADQYGSLADYCPEWLECLKVLGFWRQQWKDSVEPALALAGEGRYLDALRRLDELTLDIGFPGVEDLRLEWDAHIPITATTELHWDGLKYVRLPSGAWLSQTPITVQAFVAVFARKVIIRTPGQRPTEPIVNTAYVAAEAYCRAVGGRLPSSAEWISAARAHPDWPYPCGPTISPKYARYAADSLVAVMRYPKTRNGYYDLSGNVWEWCNDEPRLGSRKRTVVGGSFHSTAQELRLDFKTEKEPTAHDDVGFRCVLKEPRAAR